jgi:hypothetical protein
MRKENFDDSVKRILEQPEFAYDPAAWEQAQSMLAADRNRRLGGWWWTALLIAVSSIVGAGISGMTENKQLAEQPSAAIMTPTSRRPTPTLAETKLPLPVHNPKAGLLSPADSSSKSSGKKPVRLYHSVVSEAILANDTPTQERSSLAFMEQREVAALPGKNYPNTFGDGLRELPPFDFKYETRPRATQRAGSLAVFAWAGQQGRNTENQLLQQQYGVGLAVTLALFQGLEFQGGSSLAYHNGFALGSTKRDTSYAFGRTITTQTARVSDYLQLQLPIGLNYLLAEKHRFEAGGVYARYLGSNYRLQTDIQQEDGQTLSNTITMKGKINSLQLPEWSWYAGYRYSLNDVFEIGLRYQRQTSGSSFPSEQSFRLVLFYHPYRFGL